MPAPQPRALRTLAEVHAAGARRGAELGPLTQATADKVAAILAPHWQLMTAAQAAPQAA
jgi:hypothetical protein